MAIPVQLNHSSHQGNDGMARLFLAASIACRSLFALPGRRGRAFILEYRSDFHRHGLAGQGAGDLFTVVIGNPPLAVLVLADRVTVCVWSCRHLIAPLA